MLRKIALSAVTLCLCLISGCATQQSVPDLPPSLGSYGLVVARVNVLGLQAMENANVNIDGVLKQSSLREGYIAVALPPGEHKLNFIRAEGQLLGSNAVTGASPVRPVAGAVPMFIYVPGGSYTIHYTTLSVERSFTVEAGKITNLGLMVYVPVPDTDSKDMSGNKHRNFRTFTLDNTAETRSFLEANYPDLMRSLNDHDIGLAPGRYIESSMLPGLRQMIAYYEIKGPHVLASLTQTFVYGHAGTLVGIKRSADPDRPKIDVLDTGTLADIVGGVQRGERFDFLTSDAKLLEWDGSALASTPLPFSIQPVHLHAYGKAGLVIVDNRMRILTSRYSGDAWQVFEGAMIKTPRSDINLASDGAGTYISLGSHGMPEALYYLDSSSPTPQPIVLPENKADVSRSDLNVTVASDSGLFLLFNKPDFYFWSKTRHGWSQYTKPAGTCKPMQIDEGGKNLTIECDGSTYRSGDSGASWAKPSV